jgi:hypothetical protein
MNLSIIDTYSFIKELIDVKGLSTPDPYDIWKTKTGLIIKSGFYRNRLIFLPFASILSMFDIFINNSKRFFYKEQEYPIVRAQFALTLINIYSITKNEGIILNIKQQLEWLLKNNIKTANGIGWGINFKLPINKNLTYRSDTPYSTITPYVLEAFYQYKTLTGDISYDKVFQEIYGFLYKDLVIMREEENLLALSYGPLEDRIVINANSYVLYAYSMLYNLFPSKEEELLKRIQGIYNFIKVSQRIDGSWLYSLSESKTFIDCFHTCFILKNLLKTSKILNYKLEGMEDVIKNGYDYLVENFKDENNLFKHFTLSNRPSLLKYDLYDSAEFVNVSVLMKDKKNAEQTMKAIADHFISRKVIFSNIDIFNHRRNENMLRWAIMPLLLAVSNYHSKYHVSET